MLGEVKYTNEIHRYGYLRIIDDEYEREAYFNDFTSSPDLIEKLRVGDIVRFSPIREMSPNKLHVILYGVIQKAPKYPWMKRRRV